MRAVKNACASRTARRDGGSGGGGPFSAPWKTVNAENSWKNSKITFRFFNFRCCVPVHTAGIRTLISTSIIIIIHFGGVVAAHISEVEKIRRRPSLLWKWNNEAYCYGCWLIFDFCSSSTEEELSINRAHTNSPEIHLAVRKSFSKYTKSLH